jgi:hypothetical protein
MSQPSQIVQKLWNYCNILPVCRALLGAGRRDDLSAWDLPAQQQAGAQAGGMSYLLARGAQASGDYPSTILMAGIEQVTYRL